MVLVLQTKEEEIKQWNHCMEFLKFNMKWVLNNLEKLETFKVSWNHYARFKLQCPDCLKYSEVTEDYCKICKKDLKNTRMVTFGVGKPTHL